MSVNWGLHRLSMITKNYQSSTACDGFHLRQCSALRKSSTESSNTCGISDENSNSLAQNLLNHRKLRTEAVLTLKSPPANTWACVQYPYCLSYPQGPTMRKVNDRKARLTCKVYQRKLPLSNRRPRQPLPGTPSGNRLVHIEEI
jgi:hypothetical protein